MTCEVLGNMANCGMGRLIIAMIFLMVDDDCALGAKVDLLKDVALVNSQYCFAHISYTPNDWPRSEREREKNCTRITFLTSFIMP